MADELKVVDELVKWAQILQGAGIVIGVAFGIAQWRQQNQLAKAANSQALASQAADFNYKLIENDVNLATWYSYGRFPRAEPHQEERYREFLTQWLILHENIFVQYAKRLLDQSVYESWDRDLAFTVRKHNLSLLARDVEDLFPGEYGQHIRNLQKLGASESVPNRNA